jgi:hypothetical protein
MTRKTLSERIIEAAERGDHVKAEKLYAKGQYWLDRYNKLAGNN